LAVALKFQSRTSETDARQKALLRRHASSSLDAVQLFGAVDCGFPSHDRIIAAGGWAQTQAFYMFLHWRPGFSDIKSATSERDNTRLTIRLVTTALLTTVLLAVGCIRRTTVQDFGLGGQTRTPAAPAPDASIRAVFQRQTQGAFDPLVDDARIQRLQTRLKSNPADAEARLSLAAAYENYRFYDQALEQYTEALGLIHSDKAILGIARCEQALNRAWRAIPLIEQFLKEFPSAAVWNALGLLHGASGNLQPAEEALRAAVAAEPASDQWRNNLGYNLLLQNKTDEAESELRKALALNPKSAAAHNNLGSLLARRGDLQGALKEFELAADAPTAHNNLAVVLIEMGKYEESREHLVRALTLRRYFAPALSNFKLVQDRMRQRAELQGGGGARQSGVRVASVEAGASPLSQEEDKR
jgi:tetratricopeptide (TPR) repeat protein